MDVIHFRAVVFTRLLLLYVKFSYSMTESDASHGKVILFVRTGSNALVQYVDLQRPNISLDFNGRVPGS